MKMKKKMLLFAALVMCGAVVTGYALTSADSTQENQQVTAWEALPENAMHLPENATHITIDNSIITVNGTGATVEGDTVTIDAGGDYLVSGTLSGGQILINASKDDDVRLYLDGVDITADKSAIYAASAASLTVILAEDSVNTLTSNGADENQEAVLFSKCDLVIGGMGTLAINGNYKNGIHTKDNLLVTGGSLIINAANNGLQGADSVVILGGSFDITAGNDGIKSNKGRVEIKDGEFNIVTEYDGIQAESDLLIHGGVFNITAGGGSENAPVRASGFGGMGGLGGSRERMSDMPDRLPHGEMPTMPDRLPHGEMPTMPDRLPNGETSNEETESESRKGLKAKTLILITGGDFIIDTYDDAIHSNNDVTITAGRFAIKTGDDGIHADENVLITGGEIDIIQSYEGIEGLTVTIEGGEISIIASDDGINASQGEGKALNGGRPAFGANENAYIRIAGGTVDIHSGTDGIDSNGHIYIEGGILTISAPSMIMEGAIDKDGDLFITGGEIITAGSWDALPKEAAQPVILMSYAEQLPQGTVLSVRNLLGNVILEYTSKAAFSMSGFTSPRFEVGETYALFVNGTKRVDFTLDKLTTTLSDSGGEYSGGRGHGMPSGRGGGMPQGDMRGGGMRNMPNRNTMQGRAGL